GNYSEEDVVLEKQGLLQQLAAALGFADKPVAKAGKKLSDKNRETLNGIYEAWGRFWGWDPKENGAVMIVLWQLTVLHARKAGWLSSWLLHFSNVVGGVIIAFAWWGVNMLGVGLHSYGFTSGRDALDMFYGAEAVLCVLFIILHYRALRRVDVR
uniref:cytochrome c biogenesis protein CcsA n=1 Tax=uncultured Akkermansia sp. TaxID=512294 RepID=UPI002608E54B